MTDRIFQILTIALILGIALYCWELSGRHDLMVLNQPYSNLGIRG